eukprot:1832691-Prorocentrum_lima.AAC.1
MVSLPTATPGASHPACPPAALAAGTPTQSLGEPLRPPSTRHSRRHDACPRHQPTRHAPTHLPSAHGRPLA